MEASNIIVGYTAQIGQMWLVVVSRCGGKKRNLKRDLRETKRDLQALYSSTHPLIDSLTHRLIDSPTHLLIY